MSYCAREMGRRLQCELRHTSMQRSSEPTEILKNCCRSSELVDAPRTVRSAVLHHMVHHKQAYGCLILEYAVFSFCSSNPLETFAIHIL